MFEYMNPGFILMIGIFVFMFMLVTLYEFMRVYESKTKFRPVYPLYIIIALFIAYAIYDMKSTQTKVLTNKRLFDNNREIKCSTLTTTYLVSQSKGWSYQDKDNISDGNLILGLRWCEPLGDAQ